ncbi:MAG TPA: alpha/beta hydrolase [Candidatus Angelobacter sp.]|nr:alpha/beta hydrolase [Candidatus Angelobacter sp.]
MPNLVNLLIGLERFAAGMHRKSIQVGDHKVFYAEGGKGEETMVLVHGFSSSADSWNRIAGRLRKHYRLIAVDLPGWGESTRLEAASYGYPAQVERLHQFVRQLRLSRFHLVGHSMGGGISANYAVKYPDEVITLALIAPHGVIEPVRSELAASVDRGDNWLVVTSLPGFTRLLDKCFAKRPYIPGPVLKALAAQTVSRAAKTGKIFDEVQLSPPPPLVERISQIKAPTLIIWGDQDKLIHFSAAELYRKGIKDSATLIIPGSGHMPLMENARQCAETYLSFIKRPRGTAEAAA